MAAERRLFFLMNNAHRAILARVNAQTIGELGISSSQLATLYYVAKHPGCTMTEVASLLDLNKSAVSGVVQRLESAEFLERAPNPRDGRGSLLFATKKGEAARARSLPLIRRLTTEITAGFTEAEVDTIFRFLNSVVERYADDPREESP